MKLRIQKRDPLSLRSWLQLSIENSPTASLFCDCSSRVDEAAAVERIVPVRPLIVSRLGQPVLQRAHGGCSGNVV